jgi:hypothetical protein
VKLLTTSILALATLGTIGHFAFGQGEGADNQIHSFAFLENLSMLVMPDGHAMRRQISDPAMTAMILKNAKPMKTGTILFMHDGTIYMARDERTSNGKMLSAMMILPAK